MNVIAKAETIERPQSFGEELANAVSHGMALVASIAALPILIVDAVSDGGPALIVGASVFGACLLLLYLTSTIYHALPNGKGKRVFLILDHCAIFLLIAGTYTPFALGVLGGAWGWTLFGLVWGLAVLGILSKTILTAKGGILSTVFYLFMGWLVIIAIEPMLKSVPWEGILWLLGGGIAYSLGVIFFALDNRVRYAHFIWHLFVILGSFCHFAAVLWYAG